LLNKYIKCNIWRLAVRYDIYIYIYVIRRLKVKLRSNMLSSNLIKKIHNFSVFLIFLRNTYFHLANIVWETVP